jgi:hypothetical protein
MRLHQHHNLDKCLFGDQQVSYLRFTLTPEGIKPGEAKLKTIKNAAPPNDIKGIRSFMGLCNFFRHHIQDFAIIAAPLFKLTRQDSGYQSGPLPDSTLEAFKTLQTQLSKQPALAFPRNDWDYLLITKAYLPDQDSPGGLCANLAQRNNQGNIQIVSHASRQLKENEKNYTKFLLETATAAWGMDNFNEYLNGSRCTLYRDTTAETALGTTQVKTLNCLQTTMNDHDFKIKDRRKSDLPKFLRKGQNLEKPEHSSQDKPFNRSVHVDIIDNHTKPGKTIISITDVSRTFATSAVIPDSGLDSTISAVWNHWCKPYGFPETISFKQGKVQTSKLGKRINDLAPLEQKINCRSRKDTFNTEIEQQWQQSQHELSKEEFIQALNFLCDLQKPAEIKPLGDTLETFNDDSLVDDEDTTEDSDKHERHFKVLLHLDDDQPTNLRKRKSVSLCRHKLQGRTGYRSRIWRQPAEQITEFEEDDTEKEWVQLRKMEKFLEQQRMQFLRQGDPESEDEDWVESHWPEENESSLDEEEDDSVENVDLTFITSILDSFSRPKSKSNELNESSCTIFTPEGAPTRATAKEMTPPKFNHKFNQNVMIKNRATEKVSYFPTIEEEEAGEFSDREDTLSEIDLEELGEISDKEDTWSKTELDEFEFEAHSEVDTKEQSNEATFTGISSISVETAQAFSAWQPYIPPEPVFRNSSAPSWWSDSSLPEYSSLEPPLTRISAIHCSDSTTTRTPIPRSTTPTPIRTKRAHQHIWKPFRPATKHCEHIWNKPWPKLNKMCKRTRSLPNESQDHPE